MKSISGKLLISFLFVLTVSCSHSQILNPAKWTVEVSEKSVKAGDVVELIFKATIDAKWYMYANDFDPDCGPLITEISFSDIQNFEVVGPTKAINPLSKKDEYFPDCEVIKYFKKTAEFRQKIRVLGGPLKISAVVQGQVCTEIDGACIPFDEDFVIEDIAVTGKAVGQKKTEVKTPEKKTEPDGAAEAKKTEPSSDSVVQNAFKAAPVNYSESKGPILDKSILTGEPTYGNESFWALLVLSFVAGLASLITPCVFPMIPMTVTFFLKDTQEKKQGIRKAIVFGLSIIVLYSSAGTLFAVLLGPEGLNAMATNWALNLFIFAVFIVFALSFFGLFEINAPYKLVNKVDQRAEKGGLIGVFFMAFTLVLISFSCTVPIVGSVLALSAGGQILKPVLMMFSYSLAFALPFAFFAFFPEVIKSMPKSGGWLNSVKVTLGFLELALALKFFSIADQTYHWGLLDRDLNIALWIIIFGMLGFYLLGKIRLASDSVVEKISVPRLLLSIGVFSFVIYLVPGLWGAPLKALAGYLPPMYTHDFDLVSLARNEKQNQVCEAPKYEEFLHLPHGLKGYFDYEQALACAREQNKPLFIDFTGHGCTNCREMEANVWADPQVLERLKKDYVVVALYVDDKTELPESEWYTSKYDNKVKKSIGKQNADLQITNLDNNAQPFYVLVGKDERVLAWPKAYDKSVENFVEFLESGKKTYQQLYLN
jgi:thiol:disulfide interchange protein